MKITTIKSLTCQAVLAALLITPTSYAAEPVSVISSTDDGNGPANTIDNDLSTRWSASGDGEYLQYDLGEILNIDSVDIAFYKGDQRTATFDILTSEDASTWTTVFSGIQEQTTVELFNVALSSSIGQYVKVVGYGNTSNSWNSITEVDINTSDIDEQPISDATSVPALIEAEDYDDFSDTTSANKGGEYRTDAVDIQTTSDTGGGYNVGWIAASEWLDYDINVTTAGTYSADIRVASVKTTGTFDVSVDGNTTDSVVIGNTGGWQAWTTQTVDLGELSTGEHTIRIDVTGSNFNLNWIDVQLDDTDTDTDTDTDIVVPQPELSCDEMYSCWSDDNTGSVTVTGSTYSATPDSLNDVLDGLSSTGGDEIIITGSGEISLKAYSFTNPVLIRAATVGGTSLENVTITNSNNIAIQGFLFPANSDVSNRVKIVNSTNIKVLRNEFDHSGVTESQTTITTTQASQYVEIAYNTFKDKDVSDAGSYSKITGSYIKTQLDEDETTGELQMTKNLHVHHNHFSNIKHYMQDADTVAGDSDREVIAMGIADSQDEITNNVVEFNLFDNCDGENEIITVKTSNNVFRYNTFKNSMGSLSFRLGNNNIALGNYFYGEGASTAPDDDNYQTGGVRTYSDGHIIRDNYMEGLTGTTWRLPILVDHGDNSDTLGGDSHQNSTNVLVYNNTLVDNQGGLTIGGTKYGNKPTDISIIDNLAVGNTGELFTEIETSNNTWSGNKAFAYGDATSGMAQEELSTIPETPAFFGPLTTNDVGTDAP